MEGKSVAILNGRAITPYMTIGDAALIIEKGKISAIGPKNRVKVPKGAEVIDASKRIVVPGFIDIHTHGALGKRVDESYEAINEIAKFFAKNGTTGFLSTFAGLLDQMLKGARVARTAMEKGTEGAEVLGIHLEAPYRNPKKVGAGDMRERRDVAKIDEFEQVMKESNNTVKLVTIAPEIENGLAFIQHITRKGIVASVGHSYATYEEVLAGINAGISHSCHTYNAQRELHHREPGVVGAVLSLDNLTGELIADGHHVHPAAAKILIKAKGTDRVILVTDSTTFAGMPEGEYDFGGRKVIIEDGRSVLPRPPVTSALEGTPQAETVTLAGSIVTMNKDVENVVKWGLVSLQEAVKMASLNPAKRIGVDDRKGSLEVGKDADIVIMDEDANVYLTLVKGKKVYEKK